MFRVLGTQKDREVSDWWVDIQGAGDTETQGGVRLGGGCSGCWGHRNTGRCQTRGWMFRVLGTQKDREVSDWWVDIQGAGDTEIQGLSLIHI